LTPIGWAGWIMRGLMVWFLGHEFISTF